MKININGTVCTSIDEIKQVASPEVSVFIEEYFNSNDYVVAHTSGSTGEPKEIHLKKADMEASARITNDFFHLNNNSLFYLCLSPNYIAGKMMIVRALLLQAPIIEEAPSNKPLEHFDEARKIALLAVVPSQIVFLLNNPDKLELIENMIIGGGALSPQLERNLADRGINAYITYGMTETCSHIALAKVQSHIPLPFCALGDITVQVDDNKCLTINTPHFTQKQFITRDVVDFVDNKHFYWRGRFDNVINSGGIKIFPEEVEAKIAPLFRTARFYITSQTSEKWGEEVVIVIEYPSLPEGTKKFGDVQSGMVEKMKTLLPAHSVPRHFIAVSKIPTTSSGKIIRTKF